MIFYMTFSYLINIVLGQVCSIAFSYVPDDFYTILSEILFVPGQKFPGTSGRFQLRHNKIK